MGKIIITVEKSGGYPKGFQLRHNQPAGWQGIIGSTWAWYKYKSDAVRQANALMDFYNQPQFINHLETV